MSERHYTYISLEDGTGEYAKSCNDCGAHVIVTSMDNSTEVKHHPTCVPGECEKWIKRFEEMSDEEAEDLIERLF